MTERTIFECDGRVAEDCPERLGHKNELMEFTVVLRSGPWTKPTTRTYHVCLNCLLTLPEQDDPLPGISMRRFHAERGDEGGKFNIVSGLSVGVEDDADDHDLARPTLDDTMEMKTVTVERIDFSEWHDALADVLEECLPT